MMGLVPYKKGHQRACSLSFYHVMTQCKGSHLQAGRRVLPRNLNAGPLNLDFQPPDCEKINFSCVSRPVCGILLFWQPGQTKQCPGRLRLLYL